MFSRLLLAIALLAFVWIQDERAPDVLQPERDLATLVPERAVLYAEAPQLSAVLAQGLEHPLAKAVSSSELGAAIVAETGKSPAELLKQLDELAGTSVLPTAATLTAHGVAFALAFEQGAPKFLLLARGSDADKQRETLAQVLELVAKKFGFPGAFKDPSDEMLDAELWYVGPQLKIALRDSLVLASNDGKLLRSALELAAHADGSGLAKNEVFARSANARAPRHLAWAWADLDQLEKHAPGDGVKKLRAVAANPGAQFILGPGMCALGRGEALSASLDLDREDLALELRSTGLELGAAAALLPGENARWVELGTNASDAVEARVYRPAAAVFAHRVELFPADELPGFAKATSQLALFFGGRDFSEAILPHVSPWVRVVARPVEFDAKAKPEIPLPAGAAVFLIDEPDELGPVLMSAFQTAIGLINVDRAQKGLDSLLMQLELVDGVQMTSAHFMPPHSGDGVDLRYNLAPACAMVGNAFIVGTHSKLVAEIVRDLKTSKGGGSTTAGELASVAGRAVADLVRANFEALAAQAVLNEGKTRAKAEGDLHGLIGLLDLVQNANVHVEYVGATEVRARVLLDLVAARN